MEPSTIERTEIEAVFNEAEIEKQRKQMVHPILFRLAMIYMLPLGFLTGLRITRLDDVGCDVKVPYKFLNKNPFKTTYWAVLGMAAEMASGAILLNYARNITPSVATFVVGCDSKFLNRALNITTFKCDEAPLIKEQVMLAAKTGEAQSFITSTNGYAEDGTIVAEFVFTWSIKGRRK